MTVLDKAVSKGDDGWDFACPGVQGSPCGDPATGVSFTSTGWPTKASATERGREHFAEHKGEGVTSSLEEFRAKHGLGVTDEGRAFVRLEELA